MKEKIILFVAVACIALLSGCAKYDYPEEIDKTNSPDYFLYASDYSNSEIIVAVSNEGADMSISASDRLDYYSDNNSYNNILWFNETTKELRFKDNYSMKNAITDFRYMLFFLSGEYLFSSVIYVSSINSQIINSLVLFYNGIENKFFLLDGYPVDVSVIGEFTYESQPGLFLSGDAASAQALREENKLKIASEWEKFINKLKQENKLKN